ncbi:tetratricopeptide repeat protein [Saccharothrix longispora]|uniref:tetratricopeptide repeat protein n=1 Tax=Saccharothrix longispora TaxID=33920 RepID=UPI0028FD0F9D|nr:tetratricopeptide repeat protein [Saccharothrix longispora]MBY8849163.1 tetratricopeptide repeat protein [Saccharothrix sp. MB29]MDU0291246.1 tetratricopeptide repeat protein [Saccharothrix longispora]
MDLGAPHGIRFRFEAGVLRAVLLDVHGKPPVDVAEHLTAEAGARDLAVEETRDGHVRAVLRQVFDLPAPARWRLAVDAPAVERPDGVGFALPGAVSLRVSGSVPCSARDGGVVAELPAGSSELDLTVTSEPVFDVGDTVVVCRADQVREAAVVLSCLPADRFTPLLTPAGGESAHRHDALVAELLAAMGVRRAVFLDDPDPALLPGVPERVHLPCDGPVGLTAKAWELLRGGEPERTLDIAPDADPITALAAALRTGAALRVTGGPEDADAPPVPFDEHDPVDTGAADTDEAVLVERTGTAADLVAALYARHRGARLVVVPAPDLDAVRRVVAEEQERVTAAAGAIGDAVKGIGFVEALWRYLSTGGHDPYAAVEAAVTAQVPREAVEAVGERRLTAFTTGLPYPFVRTADVNWARKPVGHVVADPALVVLTELHRAGVAREPAAFGVVLDPGAFAELPGTTAPTGHHTHPIVRSGEDVPLDLLRVLVERLPVELLFFNSHDADDVVVLGGRELPERDVPLTLRHRPIVFNNSCRPWTDLAREFTRAGARGYIGTLWTIPAGLAAGFARTVVRRLTAEESPAAHAIVNTGTPGGIERSYLYAGTVNGRLDVWRDRSTTDAEAALTGCGLLADLAALAPEQTPADLARLLCREIRALREVAEAGGATGTPSYADVLLAELALEEDDARAEALLERVDAVLPALDLPEDEVEARWATRYRVTGSRAEARGEYAAAVEDFEHCVALGDACRDRADVLLRMARLLMLEGRTDEAREVAVTAHDEHRVHGDRAGLLESVTVLAGIGGHDPDTGMRYAVEGHDLAAELGDRARQAAFALDECARHRAAGAADAAVEAGVRALELFRAEQDGRQELVALRLLGGCHRDRGELETAQHYAAVGLARAEQLGAAAEVASFHDDLGGLLTARGEHAKALEHYRHAVEKLVATGAWERGAELLPHLAVGAVRAGDPEALWTTALCGGLVCEVAPREVWASLVPLVVDSMKRAIETGPFELTERGMTDFASAVTAGRREDMPFQVGLLADVVVVLLAWLMGRVERDVLRLARELDRSSGGVLDLAAYVSVPFAERVRAPRPTSGGPR